MKIAFESWVQSNWRAKKLREKNLPTISTTRNVSMIGSITSSGIRDNLLFWMFNVSSEFRFSNDEAGNTDILESNINIEIDWLKRWNIHEFDWTMILTHFSVDSRMLLNHHIQWMHLQEWRLCCLNVNPNAVNDVMVSMHHLVSDGYCYRPIEDIANFLNSNSKEKTVFRHLSGYVSCHGIALATAGSVRNSFYFWILLWTYFTW